MVNLSLVLQGPNAKLSYICATSPKCDFCLRNFGLLQEEL